MNHADLLTPSVSGLESSSFIHNNNGKYSGFNAQSLTRIARLSANEVSLNVSARSAASVTTWNIKFIIGIYCIELTMKLMPITQLLIQHYLLEVV